MDQFVRHVDAAGAIDQAEGCKAADEIEGRQVGANGCEVDTERMLEQPHEAERVGIAQEGGKHRAHDRN